MKFPDEFEPYGLPKEIFEQPLIFVGMIGLDLINKIHKTVWEAFTANRRSDRLPLKFNLLQEVFELPPLKQKRQSYEWYTPKGILKANWISKYLDHLPALIVLFWDLDWNQPDWNDQKTFLSQKIQALKLGIGGRNIRLAVILMQTSSVSSLPGDDGGRNSASEKAASLCASCDLPPKHLFVLPLSDSHLLGYTIRLENALSEIAGGFYLGEVKGIKSHKDFLNKTNHQLLFIRHQFKIAFHHEIRGDSQASIKHYMQCYQNLLDHRITDTNLQEIRTVAAIVNYKICKLNFILNLPRDSIEQFRKHVDVFRQRTGPKQLIFEHYAWLSKQYEIFGDAFETAVRDGLPAVQTQHPGFYYQQAAHYAVLRKNTAMQVCKNISPPEKNFLTEWPTQIYYGQRPWRPEKHSLEPPEAQSEQEGVKAICYNETHHVDHSNIIIPQFSAAINQFKKHRCPRLRKYLMVQMATEYYESNDTPKALTLLNHVMCDYRREKWFHLLSSCSILAVKCAYQMTALQDYLALCLEVMGPHIQNGRQQDKQVAYENLTRILNFEVPHAPEGMDDVAENWSYVLQSSRLSVVVPMDNILSCIRLRAGFECPETAVDTPVSVSLRLKNLFNGDLQLFYVILQIDSPTCAQLTETDPDKLCLKANSVSHVRLSFQPSIQDSDRNIKITGITLGIGTASDRTVALHWKDTESYTQQGVSTDSIQEFSELTKDDFKHPPTHPAVKICSRKQKLRTELILDENALVWEWLPVKLILTNEETVAARDVSLTLTLTSGTENQLERTTQVSLPSTLEDKLGLSSLENLTLVDFSPGDSQEILLYVKALIAAKRTFVIKIKYFCEVEVNKKIVECPVIFEEHFTIRSKIPFQINIETQSMSFSAVSNVGHQEKFVFVPRIKCSSHVPIEFTNSSITLENCLKTEDTSCGSSYVSGVEIENGEEATDCFCVSFKDSLCPPSLDTGAALGQYILNWRRSELGSPIVTVSVPLPTIQLEDYGIWVSAIVPPQATVRVPMTISYTITNTSDHVQELCVSMIVSDAFMFSGPKEIRLRILPGWKDHITFTLYPLLAGFVQLPRLCVSVEWPKSTRNSANLDEYLKRILPAQLFVIPQEKSNTKMTKEDIEE